MMREPMRGRTAIQRGAVFVAVGLLLYGGVFAASESLVYRRALRNRFYAVKNARPEPYDYVILGASHALPLDFADTNSKVEQATGARIINLAMPGAGIVPNRLVLEYFLAKHRTRAVVYVLDSFIVTSRQWNEDRLTDVKLMHRAPFDPALARLMVSYASRGLINPLVPLNYITGFPKVNNADRFKPDMHEMEGKYDRVYRPSEREARKRVEYLYPKQLSEDVIAGYIGMFAELSSFLRARSVPLIVVKLPVPAYYAALLPREDELTRRLMSVLDGDVPFYDLTRVGNDERFFFDTDHLNRDGVRNLLDARLVAILREHLAPATAPDGP